MWYELVETLVAIDPALLNDCPNLSGFSKRFQVMELSVSCGYSDVL